MHNNVKFVLRDEDIHVWWGQLVFWFILRVGVCAFPHVLTMEKSKNAAHPSEDNSWNSPYATPKVGHFTPSQMPRDLPPVKHPLPVTYPLVKAWG